jgi:hypothetical protein
MSRLSFDEVCHRCRREPNDSRRHCWCPMCHAIEVALMNANCAQPATADGPPHYAGPVTASPPRRRRPTRRRVRFVTSGTDVDVRVI